MSIYTKTLTSKIVAGATGVAMALSMTTSAFAQSTSTMTTAELTAQINSLLATIASLQAQLAGMQGGSTTVSGSFMANLTVGSTGADVTKLQTWLVSKGYLTMPAGTAMGYFGALTKAAVMKYQMAKGISPVSGYFGPLTRAAINAEAGAGTTGGTTGGTTTGGVLQGGAGRLTNVDMAGDVESDLNEGDAATQVIGFSAEARDSDVAVQRIDVKFTIGGNGSSNLSKYIDTVGIYQDGKKIASMDATDGDKDGSEWTYRFSDVNGVIKEGKSSDFYVAVTPVSSIGSAEAGDTITAEFETDAIRATDAEGVSETYTPTGTKTQDFSVDTATTGQLTVTTSGDNDDKAVTADADTTTSDVTLLTFKVKATDQDITINDLPVTFATSSGVKLSDMIQTLQLKKGSTVLKSKSMDSSNSTTTVVFDNIDQTINEDESVTYSVVATMRKIDSTTFVTGNTLVASVASSNYNWDAEDANGDVADVSGTATGGTVTFSATGMQVDLVSANVSTVSTADPATSGSADTKTFALKFKVTAGDDDLYVARTVNTNTFASGLNSSKLNWSTTTTAGNTTGTSTDVVAEDSDSSDAASYYFVPAGTSRTITLSVTLKATSSSGYDGVKLTGIGWGTTTSMGNTYTTNLTDFKTTNTYMQVI